MISLVTGKVGSGKTLYCVGLAVEHIAKGGVVYTNIAFNRDALAAVIVKRYRRRMFPEQLRMVDLNAGPGWHDAIEFGNDGLPVLVLLDEIHLFFNSRDWAKTQALHSDMLSFLSQSRKVAVDVVFIAQVGTTLEKQKQTKQTKMILS